MTKTIKNSLIIIITSILAFSCSKRNENINSSSDEQLLRDINAIMKKMENNTNAGSAATGIYKKSNNSGAQQQTVLEKIYELETALSKMKAQLFKSKTEMIKVNRTKERQASEIAKLKIKEEALDREIAKRENAINALKSRDDEISRIKKQLITSELSRLQTEKIFYEIAREIAGLETDQTKIDLIKESVKNRTRTVHNINNSYDIINTRKKKGEK